MLHKQIAVWQKQRQGGSAMAYIDLKYLSEPEFKRLCGVSRNTFTEMALGVAIAHRNVTDSVEDRINSEATIS